MCHPRQRYSMMNELPEIKPLIYCKTCKHALLQKTDTFPLWKCPKHKVIINDYTLASAVLGCKGKDYEERGKDG